MIHISDAMRPEATINYFVAGISTWPLTVCTFVHMAVHDADFLLTLGAHVL